MSANTVRAGSILPLYTTVRNESRDIVNISAATALTFYLRKPNGKRLTLTPALRGDGTDGELEYITDADTLDVPGVYYFQAAVTLGGIVYLSDTSSFLVSPRI
jgi:hypothetical protein